MTQDILAQFAELARVSPKTDLVIFAGRVGGRLMDNAKYLYRHCVQAELPFRSLFLTHHIEEQQVLSKAGLPSLLFPSNEAVRLLPRAKVVVADDSWWKTETPAYHLLSQARTLQLWHGIPLKLIGFPEIESSVNMTPEKADHLRVAYSGYDAAVSTSPFVTETSLGRVFEAREMWETGYPRNDVLLREPDAIDFMGVDMEALKRIKAMRKAGYKVVFFMPTFRDTGGTPFSDGALDPAAMEAFGSKHKIVFALKFHPYISLDADLGMKTVFIVRPDTDAYPLMRYADCLLTDYSSVAYDFLLTGRPQVFFPYDLAKYLSRDRAMFYPFEEMAPGPKPTDQASLFGVLRDILVDGRDEYVEEREQLTRKLFTHCDGRAAERISERMVKTFFS
jgi:CDP-glycerol glycerophosphotransferase